MLFGNENRHLNNIAVLRRGDRFAHCPLFDLGTGLLTNVRDNSTEIELKTLMCELRARPSTQHLPTKFVRLRRCIAPIGVGLIEETSLPALTAPLSFDSDARQSRYPHPRGNLHESTAGKAGAMAPQSLRTAFDKETGRLAPCTAQKLTAFTSHHDSGQFFSYFLRKPKFDTLQSQGAQ